MIFKTISILRITTVLFLVTLLSLSSKSQSIDSTIQTVMDMRSIGPAGMSGRVTAIDAETDNPEVIYIGTASGGVWKSASGGITWDPIFDDNPLLGIGSVAINQKNTDEIWVGTGEGRGVREGSGRLKSRTYSGFLLA